MAIACVQATSAQSTGATSVTTPGITTTAGNAVVSSTSCNNASAIGTSAVTDSKSNTHTRIYTQSSGTRRGAGFYCLNILGGASHTFTFTPPSSGPCAIGVAEFSGVAGSSALDQSASAGSSSTSLHSSGATSATTQADELLVGFGTVDSGAMVPVGDPAFTDIVTLADNSPEGLIMGYRIVAATGAYKFTFSYVTTTAEGVGIATFKGSGIAYVQSVSVQSSGATSITTPSFTSTAGNALVAGIGAGANIPVSPMSDNKSSTWASAWLDNTATSAKAACHYALNIPGGAGQTVTYTPTSSTFCALGVGEFSGIDTSSALDKTSTGHAAGDPHDSGNTATTSQANELLVGVGSISHAGSIPISTVPSTAWTDVVALGDGTPEGVLLSYRIVAATAAYSFTYAQGGVTFLASIGVAGIATFKAGVSGTYTTPAGTLTFTGLAPTIGVGGGVVVSVPVGTWAISGRTPAVRSLAPIGAGSVSSQLFAAPQAADGISITPNATPSAWSEWVELDPSTSVAWLLDRLLVHPDSNGGAGSGCVVDIEVGVGAENAEVVVDRFRGSYQRTFYVSPGTLPRWPLLDAIPAGSRVSLRLRKNNSLTEVWKVKAYYYKKPGVATLQSSAQPQKTAPDGVSLTTLTVGASAWADSTWTTLIPSTATDIAIVGMVLMADSGYTEWEFELGVGASPVAVSAPVRIRNTQVALADGPWLVPVYPPLAVFPMGSKVSVRTRASVVAFRDAACALVYLELPL